MAWPFLPDTTEEEKKKAAKQPGEWKPVDHSRLTFFDKIILLVATWHYFRYTGIAISKGQKLPKDWLTFGSTLGEGKIQKELKKRFLNKKDTPHFKVVDVEKGIPVPLL